MRRRSAGPVLAVVLLGAGGCSALLDWNDFTGGDGGGAGDGGGSDAGVDVTTGDAAPDTTPTTCGAAMQCAPSAPAGWTGPVELYVGATGQGAVPSCGTGFDATAVFDGNADIIAPSATCSTCSCGAVSNESCDGPVMSFFFDSSCQTPAGTQTVTSSCEPTTFGAMSVTVAAPLPSGGTCAADGGVATTAPATWGQVARACLATNPPSGTCPSGQVCAAAPASPFSTSACVLQTGIAPSCPPDYPSGPQIFYATLDDERGCSACTCGAPTGGQCTISSPAISNCVGGSLDAPNACVAFTGPEPVKLSLAPTLTAAGTCAVTPGGGQPQGDANPTGATSFCCTP